MDQPPLPLLPTTTTTTVPAATTIHLNYPDSVYSSPRSRTADTDDEPLPPVPGAKLRLMCSYGGHIIPRPHDKSLCYVGGETRLVVVDRHSTLSSLSTRLSRSLLNGRAFTLKYQLPNEDLDSLVSITTDGDLENMIEEYDRLVGSSASLTSSRIRLFLFFSKPETAASMGSLLDDTKSETWFVDVLNGSGLLPRGLSDTTIECLLNLDNDHDLEARPEGDQNREVKNNDVAHDVQYSVPDLSIVETTSSFGSSSSSPSMSNLPPIRVRVDDQKNEKEEKFAQISFAQSGLQKHDDGLVVISGMPPPIPVTVTSFVTMSSHSHHTAAFAENTTRILSDDERSDHGGASVRLRKPPLPLQPVQSKAGTAYNLPSPDSVASDTSIASASSPSKPMHYQDQVGAARREGRAPSSPSTTSEVSIPNRQIQDSGYSLPPQLDQQQQMQQPQQQFVHANMHYIPHPATTPVPISSYYPTCTPPQQQLLHTIDQQYPVYVTPVTQTQPYMSVQSNIVDASVVASSRPITPPTPTVVASSVTYNDTIPSIYPTMIAAQNKPAQLVQIPAPPTQFEQHYVGYSQMRHPSQSIAVAPAAANNAYEYASHAQEQVYYTPHQGAPLPPQYQSMTPAAAVAALADASKQLPTDNTMQKIRTSQSP